MQCHGGIYFSSNHAKRYFYDITQHAHVHHGLNSICETKVKDAKLKQLKNIIYIYESVIFLRMKIVFEIKITYCTGVVYFVIHPHFVLWTFHHQHR
ncbi:hypothetical protein T12_9172 [Trichinella patagoniensis]|uniref:Uncharacterized protein n=1 Tax=Trichinella patagoniensis TaxID=990121 RepID=A0A0V1A8Y8_9BILA|nr:hypothetical protein T12_9172 [Trichinella patagoniensis]